ncbi:MAG TPA: DUF4251 domain-containing protein [Chitinophagaceae bacterium]|nr:DUF4251 domain-containing protein [Chitinophagaceae bacterium]
MKNNNFIPKLLLILFISLSIFSNCSPTKNTSAYKNDLSASAIKNMVDSRHFIFVAESVNPVGGRFRNLTSRYDVIVSADSLITYLPYFGRAYTAPINPDEGGIRFTSTNFSYVVTHNKSDKWDIVIKPKDGQGVQQLNFAIFENGSASLNVTSNSRTPISFNGHLQNNIK